MANVDTGKDLRKVLEEKNLLGNDACISILKEFLHSIGKTDLVIKFDKYLAIG